MPELEVIEGIFALPVPIAKIAQVRSRSQNFAAMALIEEIGRKLGSATAFR